MLNTNWNQTNAHYWSHTWLYKQIPRSHVNDLLTYFHWLLLDSSIPESQTCKKQKTKKTFLLLLLLLLLVRLKHLFNLVYMSINHRSFKLFGFDCKITISTFLEPTSTKLYGKSYLFEESTEAFNEFWNHDWPLARMTLWPLHNNVI